MRICTLGNTKKNYSWFVLNVRDGCSRLGHEIVEVDYRTTQLNRIREIIKQTKPRYLFTHLSFHANIHPTEKVLSLYKDIKKDTGVKIVHFLGDARIKPRYDGDISSVFDAAFVSQTQTIDKIRKQWKVPTFYWQYSSLYQESIAPINKGLKFNIPVFTGAAAHQDRLDFLSKIQKRMKIKWIKTQSSEDLRHRTPELSSSAASILGLCTGYNIVHYTDVRPWQYLGAGACMIMRPFLKMDDIIPEDLYYPIYGYTEKDADKVKEYHNKILKTDTCAMRRKAFEFMQKHHSTVSRFRDIINVLEGKTDKVKIFLKDL